MAQDINATQASRPAEVTTRKPRRLSDLVVTQGRVTVSVDGHPMEAVRVPVDLDFVWRIKLTDRLSDESFPDADQAVHWMATGMRLPGEATDPGTDKAADASEGWVTYFEPEAPRPDPVWLPLDWVPRLRSTPVPKDPLWVAIQWEPKRARPSAASVPAFSRPAAPQRRVLERAR